MVEAGGARGVAVKVVQNLPQIFVSDMVGGKDAKLKDATQEHEEAQGFVRSMVEVGGAKSLIASSQPSQGTSFAEAMVEANDASILLVTKV
mmetsp:Transcript_4670/g.5901  ORF Transcript_4670/g.5901 Transcript_4670/m.5901 type:complete len:91 (+) Transcript_4670:337-609(+)